MCVSKLFLFHDLVSDDRANGTHGGSHHPEGRVLKNLTEQKRRASDTVRIHCSHPCLKCPRVLFFVCCFPLFVTHSLFLLTLCTPLLLALILCLPPLLLSYLPLLITHRRARWCGSECSTIESCNISASRASRSTERSDERER